MLKAYSTYNMQGNAICSSIYVQNKRARSTTAFSEDTNKYSGSLVASWCRNRVTSRVKKGWSAAECTVEEKHDSKTCLENSLRAGGGLSACWHLRLRGANDARCRLYQIYLHYTYCMSFSLKTQSPITLQNNTCTKQTTNQQAESMLHNSTSLPYCSAAPLL